MLCIVPSLLSTIVSFYVFFWPPPSNFMNFILNIDIFFSIFFYFTNTYSFRDELRIKGQIKVQRMGDFIDNLIILDP
jgi:hypothetical protein